MKKALVLIESLDGDRWWLVVGSQRVAYVRLSTLQGILDDTDFGPQELVPVIQSAEMRVAKQEPEA